MSKVSSPPLALLVPIKVPKKLLLGPGPSNVSPRVLEAASLPVLGHLHSEYVEIMDECKLGIKYLFQTSNSHTFAVSGSGHAAMECVTNNLIEDGDVVLIGKVGIWGDRFAEMCRRIGAYVVILETSPMFPVEISQVEMAMSTHKPKLLFLTHGESSVGLLQPLEGFGKLCHQHGCLLVVDAVATAGAVPLYMDQSEIDVLYSGAQKALSAMTGASPISFSPKAVQKAYSRKTPCKSFYFDLTHLANYWGIEEGERRYHHTGLISCVYSLRESLAMLAEETLEISWKRHKSCSSLLHRGLKDLGLQLFLPNPEIRLPTVTTVTIPDGVDGPGLCRDLMKRYHIEISKGLGPTAGKVWRIGIMGYNAREKNVQLLLRCLKEGLQNSSSFSKLSKL